MTSKRIKRFHVVDPEIWNHMQRRLKYTTSPELKNLLAADEDLKAALAQPSLAPEDKQRLVADAIQ